MTQNEYMTVPGRLPVLSAAFYRIRDSIGEAEDGYGPQLACSIRQMTMEENRLDCERSGDDYVAGLSLANGEKEDSEWSEIFAALRLLVPERDGKEDNLWPCMEALLLTLFQMGIEIGKQSQEAPG